MNREIWIGAGVLAALGAVYWYFSKQGTTPAAPTAQDVTGCGGQYLVSGYDPVRTYGFTACYPDLNTAQSHAQDLAYGSTMMSGTVTVKDPRGVVVASYVVPEYAGTAPTADAVSGG